MADKKLKLSSDEFVQGLVTYAEFYPGDNTYKMVINVNFGALESIPAILDTGAPWCVLGPEEAADIGFDYRVHYEEKTRLTIRMGTYSGWLVRMPVSIKAKEGEGITIDATVFIPDAPIENWGYPNFLGLGGFLDRMRFAVDPENNSFYFGALDA